MPALGGSALWGSDLWPADVVTSGSHPAPILRIADRDDGGAASHARARAALDFGSILAGAESSLTVTVKGAKGNDVAIANAVGAMETGMVMKQPPYVSVADTVTIRLLNTTGGTIDPASRTWVVRVLRQSPETT